MPKARVVEIVFKDATHTGNDVLHIGKRNPRTFVRKPRGRFFIKFEAQSRAQLMIKAVRAGVLQP